MVGTDIGVAGYTSWYKNIGDSTIYVYPSTITTTGATGRKGTPTSMTDVTMTSDLDF